MRSSTSGFLLLILGAIGLIGFLTGNLDRWLAYLFAQPGAPLATSVGPTSPAVAAPTTGNRRTTAA